MIYPFFTDIGNMKVSEAMHLLNLISKDWNLKLYSNPEKQKMLFHNNSFIVAKRILKNSVRNN